MSLGTPIWHPSYAGLLVRFPLGIYFLSAGCLTIANIKNFVTEVPTISWLPDKIAPLYAAVLPYTELIVGVLLILGLWTTLAAILSSAMLLSFVLIVGPFPYGEKLPIINKDIILLCASLSLLASGAGGFSIDKPSGD